MKQIKTTSKFIEDALKIHGNKYDYSITEYNGAKSKVKIICPIHGMFEQNAQNHTNGSGCKICAISAKTTRIRENYDFIEKSKQVHGELYNYGSTTYLRQNLRVKIECRHHGIFEQIASDHLSGHGCPTCAVEYRGNNLRHTLDDFISKAKLHHGEFYDYSLVTYKNIDTKVQIICPDHGIFEQVPYEHSIGHGCVKCSHIFISNALTKTSSEFISSSKKVHGDLYDYSNVNYRTCKDKVTIICYIHGEFLISPTYHLMGGRCPICNKSHSRPELEWLSYHRIPNTANTRQVKIYIDGVLYKVDGYIRETNTIYEFWGDYWHGNPAVFKSDKINTKCKKTFGELYRLTMIKRDNILKAGYNLIDIWESDWYKLKTSIPSCRS